MNRMLNPNSGMQGFIGGAGKRKKIDDEGGDTSKIKITQVVGEITVKDGDSEAVKKALNESIDIEEWLNDLPISQLEKVRDYNAKTEDRGHSDAVLRALSKYLPIVEDLEASHPPL